MIEFMSRGTHPMAPGLLGDLSEEVIMVAIVLNPVQENQLRGVTGEIEVTNANGRRIGVLVLNDALQSGVQLDPEVAKILAERMSAENVEWRTTEQVLKRLDQIDRQCSG